MRKISLAEPVTELRHVPIIDNGEPLVDFLAHCPDLAQDAPRFLYRRETLARQSVARMLCEANETLMKRGFRLAIVEGWRPPHIQRRMYMGIWNRLKERNPEWSEIKLRRVANRYTAPLHGKVPPPHSTGGAVDLILADLEGTIQDHCSPYDTYDPACYLFHAKGLSDAARRTRELLREAIEPTGMTNYPSEYWHWTYGDQGWAYRGGHPHALYGPITPEGYMPAPEDLSDQPLVLQELSASRKVSGRGLWPSSS
jgi:D-alanyl-D-alanine dipeptidase